MPMNREQVEKLARDLNFREKKFVDEMPEGVTSVATEIEKLVMKNFRGDSLVPGRLLALVVKLARELRGKK